ncbi:Tricarboxylate transport protein TctC [Serinicoccus hydrothermalis]|uniref:Tricarboxylate transport protein TctC n=1 Tax=Serinicoccus hydrothermalis TaxID=1758689 RepID=A0A1B1N9K8_9MICO|nr:tripartite tricarboxylate transporter substrate binding protein [Serinicoccus hydrothermalis]ANS78123.1 Tricarboxylate transport protein TctC [Serinicoccus hydrothermalis]
MIRTRTTALAVLPALALTLSACGGGGDPAADYPTKRIDYVLPFDPGGESDITARLQQEPLEEALGQSVSISYQPGAGGALGWSELTRSRPDGYTVMGCNIPHIILQPMLRDDAGYETEQIKPVYFFQSTPNALLVSADSEMETVDDFVAAAKEDPGGLSVGGSGDFSANHIGTLQFADAAGIEVSYTPFDGTGAAVPALLGGHVDALMSYTPQIDQLGDQVKALAVASEERMDGLDVPTFTEQGIDMADGAYRGVCVQEDTPQEIVDSLAETFASVNEDPDLVEDFREQAFVLENYGPQESVELIESRTAEYEELLGSLGMLDE